MTDNEIKSTKGMCKYTLCPEALEIINRKNKEIETLEKRLEAVQGAKCAYSYDGETIEYCVHSPCPICKTADQIKAEAVKEFAERLKDEGKKNIDKYTPKGCDLYFENGTLCGYVAMKETIDNLVKEMTAEASGNAKS